MAERSPGARVVRQRLGRGLRELREQANIRIEAAARELECSPAKISRLENGQGPAKLWDVRILLGFYGVEDDAVRARYEEWARGTKAGSWWESDSDLTSDDVDRYLAAETVASRVRVYSPPVLPAVLQTEAYAAARLAVLFPEWSVGDVERFVVLQKSRQDQLLRADSPVTFEAIVDESALLTSVGDPDVHAAQLEWLIELIDQRLKKRHARLDFRVVPLMAGPSRALSPFTVFDARNPDLDPSSGFIEEMVDQGAWVDSIDELSKIFDELRDLAAGTEESLEILREAAKVVRGAGRTSAPAARSDERMT